MATTHQAVISKLRDRLDKIRFDDLSLVSFRGKRVMTRGFFPGGNGLFAGDAADKFPIGGALVLGSNFGAVHKYNRPDGSLVVEDEISDRRNETWPPLLELLRGAGISPDECFFTNAWPCLHQGTSNTKGVETKRWLAHPGLMMDCSKFFASTRAEMRPSLILALGLGSAAFLASSWQPEIAAWRAHTISGMDRTPIIDVTFAGMDQSTVCTAVVHPSYQRRNAELRMPPYRGVEGEIRLVKEAYERR